MAPPFDGSSGVVTGDVGGEVGGLFEPSFVPPHALNRRAVAVLSANASEVFRGESIFVSRF
jgi:hypothetical protein